jgi:hypothetical protein
VLAEPPGAVSRLHAQLTALAGVRRSAVTLIHDDGFVLSFTPPAIGRLRIALTATSPQTRQSETVASGATTYAAIAAKRILVRLTDRGRVFLRTNPQARVTVTITYTLPLSTVSASQVFAHT